MDSENNKVLSIMKERDYYRAKVDELTKKVRKLEYDNAELQKRDNELSARVKDLASKTPYKRNRYNNRVHH